MCSVLLILRYGFRKRKSHNLGTPYGHIDFHEFIDYTLMIT